MHVPAVTDEAFPPWQVQARGLLGGLVIERDPATRRVTELRLLGVPAPAGGAAVQHILAQARAHSLSLRVVVFCLRRGARH
jgi:hypothetical protein